MKLQAKRLISVSTIALLSTLDVGCGGRPANEQPAGDSANAAASIRRVNAQGRILPAQGFVRLAAVGTVKQVHVQVGQKVQRGELLVTMQSRQAIELQLAVARKRLAEAQRQQDSAVAQAQLLVNTAHSRQDEIKNKRQLLEDQSGLLSIAHEQLLASQDVLTKLENIADYALTKEFVGQLEIDRQKVAIQDARLQYEQQAVAHKQASAEVDFAEKIAYHELQSAEESLSAALGSKAVEIVESEIDVLKKQSEAARIRAPTKGEIIGINVQAGESSVQMPIIEMADFEQLVCEVEINELDAARVHEKDKALITSRAFGDKTLHGNVKRKSKVVGRPQLKPFDPLAPVDYRSVTAVIELDDASQQFASEWLQLQVEVEIEVDSGEASTNSSSNSTSVEGTSSQASNNG